MYSVASVLAVIGNNLNVSATRREQIYCIQFYLLSF